MKIITGKHLVRIVARAENWNYDYDLYAGRCKDIIRETFDSSVRPGHSALIALGTSKVEAEKVEADKL